MSYLNHDSLLGFVADEHVAHGGVSMIAGAGLTGGALPGADDPTPSAVGPGPRVLLRILSPWGLLDRRHVVGQIVPLLHFFQGNLCCSFWKWY